MKIDPAEIEITTPLAYYDISEYKESLFGRRVFNAEYKGRKAGEITVLIAIRPNLERMLKDRKDLEFYMDTASNPMNPIPVVDYQETKEKYWGNGISGMLIVAANDFCKRLYGTPLHSDNELSPEAISIWEKLAEQGKASEHKFFGYRRWKMN